MLDIIQYSSSIDLDTTQIIISGVLMIDALLLAFFIISPKIGMYDLSLIALAIHTAIAFFSDSQIDNSVEYIDGRIIIMYVMVVIIAALSVTSFLYNGGDNYDEQFLFKPFRILLLLFTLYYIFIKRKISLFNVFSAIIIAALLNAIVIYSQYIDSFLGGAGDFLQNPNFNKSAFTPYRKAGLMSGFPVAGILSFCGSVIAFHLFTKNKGRWYLLLYAIIGATCFLTARTALFLFIISSSIYLLMMFLRKGRVDLLILFAMVLSTLFVYTFNSENDVIIKTREKMFANVIHYAATGNANDYSTNDLFTNHYVLPSGISTFLIGNSIPPENNIVNTDVSFFRITWNSGFFSMLLYVCCYLFMWFVVFLSSHLGNENKMVLFLLFAGVFISNFKGSYFFSRVVGDLIFIIFIACIVNKSNKEGGDSHG